MKKLQYCSKLPLSKVCQILDNDGIIVYPTDTVYGFGCNANNILAIKKLNRIKNRTGPMSIIAPNIKVALSWMSLSSQNKSNAQRILEKSQTIIVPTKKKICSDLIKGDNNSIGIRIPNHPFCKNIALNYSSPITTTSVNRTGKKPLTNPKEIENEFYNEIDLIIEDGIIKGKPSKIYLYQNGNWKEFR